MHSTAIPAKPLFSHLRLPLLVASLSEVTADEAVCALRNAMLDGAEASMMPAGKC